jgi:hypothetical protein
VHNSILKSRPLNLWKQGLRGAVRRWKTYEEFGIEREGWGGEGGVVHEGEMRRGGQPRSCWSQVQIQRELASGIWRRLWREKRADIYVADNNGSQIALLANEDALVAPSFAAFHNYRHVFIGTLPMLLEIFVSSAHLNAAESLRPDIRVAVNLDKRHYCHAISVLNTAHISICSVFKSTPHADGRNFDSVNGSGGSDESKAAGSVG